MNHSMYSEGQAVEFDFGTTRGKGRIRGLVSNHILDVWIVEVTESVGIDKTVYPWSCIAVAHPSLKATPKEESEIPVKDG